jgi:hypothetical protein
MVAVADMADLKRISPMTLRTSLEWDYQPKDFFERRTVLQFANGMLTAENGRVTYTLEVVEDPLTEDTRLAATSAVRATFDARLLSRRQEYTLGERPVAYQYQPNGGRNTVVYPGTGVLTLTGFAPRVLVADAQGNVVHDSEEKRLSTEFAQLQRIASKAGSSPILQAMLESFRHAVADPANELVHLYELKEAVAAHFGGEHRAAKMLGTSWTELKRLANDAPVRQGRHRGKKLTELRDATREELQTARAEALRIIEAFAKQL